MSSLFLLIFSALFGTAAAPPVEKETIEPGLAAHLAPYEGCIVLYDLGRETIVRSDAARCATRKSPCSTFKIYNSLVGLDTGVVKDETTLFEWDGVKRSREEWNRDHTLESAFKASAVWWYQRMAREVGEERMRARLAREPFGNGDMSGGIDRFWLESSMQVSPDEQVRFLARLYRGRLAFKPESVAVVKKILLISDESGVRFSGKTGSGRTAGDPALGWFVGHVSSPKGECVFAVQIEGDDAWGPKARDLAKKMLAARGWL
jgi:bla regulator protein BlaR1